MAYESDQRVVQLVFDNKRFEANVSQTLDSLDKLKDSLKFEGAEKGFDNIEKATKDIDFSGMADNIDYIASRFTLWGKAVDFVKDKIVTGLFGAVSSIKSEVESMTAIGQLGGAWQQYADQVSAVQTIMAATREQFAEGVNQMEAVNAQVERLQWFTDETSYNLMDMVSNIGKFTSQSVRLDKAVTNMEGIAVWTSLSGGSIDKATTAMEVFSKSLGAGYVELRRWQQLETANLVTTEFKNTLLETAEEVGTLKKKADGLWETLDGTEVTFANLSTTLTKGKWFDSNVIDSLFTKYGAFANKLSDVYTAVNELSDGGEVTTSTLIKAVKEMKNGETEGEAFRKVLQRTGMTAEELHGYLDELASDEYDLGFRAMTAAQEAKTFREAIDSVGTAVRTSWAKSFEIIFGNYEEAKEMWTDLANYLWDVFNGSAEARNEILSLWKAAGGRDDLIQSFRNLAAAAESVVQPIKDAWNAVFWPGDDKEASAAETLYKFTYYLKEITAQMTMSEKASTGLMRAFQLLFTPVKWVATGLKWVLISLLALIAVVGKGIDKFLGLFGSIELTRQGLVDFISSSKVAQGVLIGLAVALGVVLSPLIAVGVGIYALVNYIRKFESVSDWWKQFNTAHPEINKLAKALQLFWQNIKKLLAPLKQFMPTGEDFLAIGQDILNFFKNIPKYASIGATAVTNFVLKIANVIDKLASGEISLKEFGKYLVLGLGQGIISGFSWIGNVVARLFNVVKTTFMNVAGIHSPSLIFKLLGMFLVAGLVLGILNSIPEVQAAISQLFSQSTFDLTNMVNNLKSMLGPVNHFLKRFWNNLTAGQIVFLMLGASALTLSINIGKIGKAITGVFSSVSSVLKSVSGLIDSVKTTLEKLAKAYSRSQTGKLIKDIAISVGILTASILAIAAATKVLDKGDIENAFKYVAILAGIISAVVVIVSVCAAISKQSTKFTMAMSAFAVGVAALAGGVYLLSNIENPQKAINTIGYISLILALTTGLMGMMQKVTKSVPQGALALVGIAFAISRVCQAFSSVAKDMAELDSPLIDEAGNVVREGGKLDQMLKNFLYILGATSVVLIACSSISVKKGAGALLAILGIKLLMSSIGDLAEACKGLDFSPFNKITDSFKNGIESFINYFNSLTIDKKLGAIAIVLFGSASIILAIVAAVRTISHVFTSLATVMAVMVISFWAIGKIIDSMSPEAFEKSISTMKAIFGMLKEFMIIFGTIIGVLALFDLIGSAIALFNGGNFNQSIDSASKTLKSLAVLIIIMTGVFKAAEYIDANKAQELARVFEEFMGVMAIVLALSKLAGENAAKTISKMATTLVALGLMIGLLSISFYDDYTPIITSAASLSLAMLALGGSLLMISKAGKDINLKSILAMMLALGEVGILLSYLSQFPWEAVAAAGFGISVAMLGIAGAIRILSGAEFSDTGSFTAIVISMIGLAGAMYVLSFALQNIATIEYNVIATGLVGFGTAMIAMAYAVKVLASIADINISTIAISLLAMAGMAGSMIIVAFALQQLAGLPLDTIAIGIIGFAAMMYAMSGVIAILTNIGAEASSAIIGVVEIILLSASMIIMGIGLQQVAGMDWVNILAGTLAMIVLMYSMIGVIAILSNIGAQAVMAIIGVVEIILLSASMIIMGIGLQQVAGMDWVNILVGVIAIEVLMWSMLGMIAALGAVVVLAAMALVGIVDLIALSLAMTIMANALAGLVAYDFESMIAAIGAIEILMWSMFGMIAALGATAVLAGAALLGIVSMFLLTIELQMLIDIIVGMTSYDFESITVTMDNVMSVILKLIAITALLAVTAATSIAGGAVLLALATDLLILGTALSQLHLDAATITDDVDNITAAVQNLGNLQVLGPQAVNTAITAIQNEFRIRIAQMQIEATAAMTMAGMYIGYGLINGMGSTNQSVGYAAQAMAGAAIQGFAETAQIHSPSEVFKWLGQMLGIGSATGAVDTADENATAGAALAVSQEAGFASQEENMYNTGAEGGGTMAEGANDQQPLMAEAGNNLGQSLWSKFKGWLQKIGEALGIIKSETDGEAGTDAISNLINNFTGGNDLGSTFENLGATIKEGIGNALGIDLDGEFDLSSMLGLDNFDDIWKDFDTGAGGAAGSLDGLGSSAGGASGSTETLTEDEIELAEAIAELKRQKDEGLITEQEFIDKVNELTIAAREDRRELNELYDAYMAGELTLDQFNEKLQDLNEKAKEAVFKHQMDELVTSFQNGEIEEYEFENRMKKLTNTMEDETVPTLEELNAKLQAGAIDAKGFAEDWEKIKEAQKEADLQNEIYQLHKRLKEGKISGQEFCDEVALLTKEEKKQYNTLKELNDEYDSGTLDELQYADGMTELYEDSENLNKSMEELLNIFGSFEELPDQVKEALEGVTDNMYNLSDTYLNEAPVLRFAQGVATQFEKAISGADATLADNVSDYAVRRTEELMLAFAKMQNAEDDDIQALENWGQATTNIITKVAGQWKDYVAAAYDAMTASVSIWSNPSWQNDEYTLFEDMTRRLDDYSLGQEDWYKAMEDLAKRGLDSEMWLDLYDEGIDGLAKVLSLAQLDDTQLAELNSKQEGIRAFAKENAEKLAAVSVMVAKDAGSDAIKSFVEGWVYDPEMEDQLEEAAEDIMSTFDEALEILIDKIRNGEIVDVEQLLQTIADVMGLNSDIITNAGVTLGDQFAEGIGDGVEAMTDYAVEAVAAMAQAMIDKVMAQIRAAQASFGGSASVSISTGSALGALISTVSEAGSDILDTGSDQASSINSSFGPTTTIDQSTTTTNNVTINNNIDAKRDNLYETVVAADLTVASRLK